MVFALHSAMKIINEGHASIMVPEAEKVSKAMGVFYNPAMSINRDVSVLLLNSTSKINMQIADPLAATGIRSIRFLKELPSNKIKRIYINDIDKKAVKLIRRNLALSKVQNKKSSKINNIHYLVCIVVVNNQFCLVPQQEISCLCICIDIRELLL